MDSRRHIRGMIWIVLAALLNLGQVASAGGMLMLPADQQQTGGVAAHSHCEVPDLGSSSKAAHTQQGDHSCDDQSCGPDCSTCVHGVAMLSSLMLTSPLIVGVTSRVDAVDTVPNRYPDPALRPPRTFRS